MQHEPAQTQDNLLTGFEQHLVKADAGKRLANYIIDQVAFYAFTFVFGMALGLMAPSLFTDTDSVGFQLGDRLLSLFLYAIFMGAIEAATKGKSLGKLITGTRAVTDEGHNISTGTAFARGFSRAVPFCAFSALGTPCYPWQDRWTNTIVIDEKASNRLEGLQ